MSFLTIAIILIVFVIIMIIIGQLAEDIVLLKGYYSEEVHPYALIVFFGLFGFLYIIALPNRSVIQKEERQRNEIISLLSQLKEVSENSSVSQKEIVLEKKCDQS